MRRKLAVLSAVALAFIPFVNGEQPSKDASPSKEEIASLVKREAEASNIGTLAVIQKTGMELTEFTVKVTSIDPPETSTVNDPDKGKIEMKVWPVHLDLLLKYKEEPRGEHHSDDVWVYRNSSGKWIVLDEEPKA